MEWMKLKILFLSAQLWRGYLLPGYKEQIDKINVSCYTYFMEHILPGT